jgi:hypothetical protein
MVEYTCLKNLKGDILMQPKLSAAEHLKHQIAEKTAYLERFEKYLTQATDALAAKPYSDPLQKRVTILQEAVFSTKALIQTLNRMLKHLQ